MPSDIAFPASNFWTSQENSRQNAWNVNFSTGNVNHNNKYNTNAVRAVSALTDQDKADWIAAFDDCCRHKYTSLQCTMYRMEMEDDLFVLAAEVLVLRTYKPTTSSAFGVRHPTLREIFAANFRDRIVQHWITMRINPLFEERFVSMGNVSYNCRENFGTLAAVLRVQEEIARMSAGSAHTVIGIMDISSFFMTIDREVSWNLLKEFITENADKIKESFPNTDIDILLWVTEVTLKHNPQLDCRRCGDLNFWNEIAPNKSLFNAPPGVGLPIGNITSQLVANFVLSFLDEFIIDECRPLGATHIRFVDDIVIIARRERDVVHLRSRIKWYLEEKLHQTLHPRKFYIQAANKGARFVGHYLKPGRIYTSNRTIGNLYDALLKMENICRDIITTGPSIDRAYRLEKLVQSANSIFGFMSHTASRNVRIKITKLLEYFWKVCYFQNLLTIKIRKAYKLSSVFIKQEYENYIRINARETLGLFHKDPPAGPHHQLQPRRDVPRRLGV